MKTTLEILRYVNMSTTFLIAVACLHQWRKYRTAPARWAAMAFGSISCITVAGLLINPAEMERADQRTWLPWLQASAARFAALLRETPDGWLTRRIEMIDSPGSLSGWRILMMMLEHEIHHRSQVDTYAGLQGWPVPDIFERSAETIAALQPDQRARHRH